MSDEIRELRNEIIALKEINDKLERKISELMEKNDKLTKENEAIKAEKSSQQSSAGSTNDNDIPISQPMKRTQEEESNGFAPTIKRSKTYKERFIPNWLIYSLLWFNRKEMANSKLSTSSETFRRLCWPKLHQNVKPHKIPFLKLYPTYYEFGNVRALVRRQDKEIIPIASIQPPEDYIIGFERIIIEFVNEEIANFVKSIAHLLKECNLRLSTIPSKKNKKRVASMNAILECLANKISKLTIDGPNLNDFNGQFPGILDNVQHLESSPYGNNEIDAILNWLTKQANNGTQKLIKINDPEEKFIVNFINRSKEEFSNSNSASIFLIYFCFDDYDDEFKNRKFTLQNTRTNEILTLYRTKGNFYLARFPKKGKHWKKDGEKKINQEQNSTYIEI